MSAVPSNGPGTVANGMMWVHSVHVVRTSPPAVVELYLCRSSR